MDTKLTIEQILLSLHDCYLFNARTDIMIPNLSWGLLPYEADFVAINKSGYLTEIEIKRSFSDFKADFKKSHEHNAEQVYRFYYCVPKSIEDKVLEFINKHKEENKDYQRPAVLTYDEEGKISQSYEIDKKHQLFGFPNKSGGRKLFLEEILRVARYGQMRYWNLLSKSLSKEVSEKEE